MSENEYIKQEDYWKGYNESIDKAKDNPDLFRFSELCFLVFETDLGKELLKQIDEKILMADLVPINANNYENTSTYYAGFKHAFRTIKNNIKSHKEFIKNN